MSGPTRPEYAVGICFPCGPWLPSETALSLAKTCHAMAVMGVPVNIHAIIGSSDVVIARDAVLDMFLEGDDKFAFWIDSDIEWEPEDFVRVLRLTRVLGVACAAYPLKREPTDCIINFAEENPTQNEYGCVEILSTGLGFTCVQRGIVEEFAKSKEEMYHPGTVSMITDAFRRDKSVLPDGRKQGIGEDCAFFNDLRALGHRIWLDPSISLGHVGKKVYRVPLVKQKPSA